MAPLPSYNPPPTKFSTVTFPAEHILLVTLNRPKSLNCINVEGTWELDAVWQWYDETPQLRCAIITGNGKAFCAGADLKEWQGRVKGEDEKQGGGNHTTRFPGTGFGGLSRRSGKKPVIAAVNGMCFGGGTEMITNCDLVVASRNALFGLPEVKRGVAALAGALPRIILNLGLQRASEMALTGRNFTAEEGYNWGFVNKVVEEGQAVDGAMEFAKLIVENSPDSVIATRLGMRYGWEAGSVEDAVRIYAERDQKRLDSGEKYALL